MNELTEYLYTYFDEVEPKEFYRNIFSKGQLQEKGKEHYGDGKFNGIIIEVTEEKYKTEKGKERVIAKRHTLTDDLDKIDEVCGRDNFCLMSAMDYIGKTRDSSNAKNMYALVVEIDGVIIRDGKPWGIMNLFKQIEVAERVPRPTYIVSSGSGLHLYYVFEKPIYLYKNVYKQLEVYKHELTRLLWNDMVTTLVGNQVQYEPICQGFRVVGTRTKSNDLTIRARAFETGKKVTMEYLNSFVNDEFKVKEFTYKSELTLLQAQKKYPEWFKKKIIDKDSTNATWICNRAVYDWWKRKIKEGASCGHRYWCLRVLSMYGAKCEIDEKEVENDVFSYLDFMDRMTEGEFSSFTEDDCLAALEGYDSCWKTYPIDKIVEKTGIPIQKNKRNGRKQELHMKIISGTRDILYPNGSWREGNGRKPKKDIVAQWRADNPNGKKSQCHRDTGLSRVTIDKWWNS